MYFIALVCGNYVRYVYANIPDGEIPQYRMMGDDLMSS